MTEVEAKYANMNMVAEYFNVSLSTIRKWVHSGHIPTSAYINIGGVYRFRLDDVEAALTDKTKKVQTRTSKTKKDGE